MNLKHSIRIGKLFGINIGMHWSWFLIFGLLAWSLAEAYFPSLEILQNSSTLIYWILGLIAAILLFVCVLLHELSHSLVARKNKIDVKSITLFFFGGVAQANPRAKMTPKSEFWIAIAGPLLSIALGVIFLGTSFLPLGNYVLAIVGYLWKLNFILAAFNLFPGFPLDGGRVFRSLVWWTTKDFEKATRYAAIGGKIFAGGLIAAGIGGLFFGLQLIWFVFIGIFLYFLAGASYEGEIIKATLSKVKLKNVIKKNPKILSSKITVKEFVEECIKDERYYFLVRDKVLKVIGLDNVKGKSKKVKIGAYAKDVKPLKSKARTFDAYVSMNEQGVGILPIVSKGRLIGTVSIDAIRAAARVFSLK